MRLRNFQIEGADFLLSHDVALLCDDAGLGKSAMVLRAADKRGVRRVLCLGPAVAGVSWPGQLALWSPKRAYVDVETAGMFGFAAPGFYFVSFDMLSRQGNAALSKALRDCETWPLLVIDEGQYLKNPGSNRTRAVYGDVQTRSASIRGNASSVWVLSGTLTPNHAGEAYTHLRALFPDVLASVPAFRGRVPEQHEYEEHFCTYQDTVYGRVVNGSRNMRELRAVLAPIMLRRLKQTVMAELPPIEWLTAPITVTPEAMDVAFPDDLDATGDDDTLTDRWQQMAQLASARHTLGRAKVPGCLAWIVDRLEAGERKLIVFAHHLDVIEALQAGLLDYRPALFVGSTVSQDRAKAVRDFQHDPETRVFLGQLHACGTAITLTAAKTVVFVEYASTPGVNYQAASRAHRMGQRDGVQVYFATVPDSLDERIARTAARRARQIAEIFD